MPQGGLVLVALLSIVPVAALALAAQVEARDRLKHDVLSALRAHGPLSLEQLLHALDMSWHSRRRVNAALSSLTKDARVSPRAGGLYAAR